MSSTNRHVTVRPVRSGDDLDGLGRLIVDSYLALPGWRRDPEYEDWLGDLSTRSASAVVVGGFGSGGEPLGCVTYLPVGIDDADVEHTDPEAASFRALAVAPAAQRLGVGRSLVHWCIDRARTERAVRVRLHTIDVMTAAQAMYVSMGFVREPTLDEQWELPDGPLHGLAYRLDL